jgi:two-component system cell cycle sensor histidine kinase/response regulator CckA
MTLVAARSRLLDSFVLFRRSSVEQQNTAARPPNLRSDRLSAVLCLGAIAIGIIAFTGYVLGNASIAALGAPGKPVAAGTALALIVLGAGLLALRSPAPAGVLTARRAALAVIVLGAADLLSAALSRDIQEWQVWAARGGVIVHPYLITGLLLLASGSALVFITTRRDFAGHVIASAVLLICLFLLFGHILRVPSFLDPSTIVAPVSATAWALVLISAAELLARPRGWVIPLLSRTSAGMMLRLLLPAAIVVPFVALALRSLIADARWFTPELGLTVVIAVNVVFSAAIVLSAGAILHKRESDRMRLASIVDSSADAIIGKSSAGLIESWNSGAERIYGYTAAEAIGRSITILAPPERYDEVPHLLERVQRGERIDPFETALVTKDGRRVDVCLSVSPILDDGGNVVGASTIAQDITQRKHAQKALQTSQEHLELAQRAAGIAHFSWDIQNNISTRSDELLALHGLPPDSFGGNYESWSGPVFPGDVPALEAEIQNSLTSGELSCDFRVVWPDASIHWLHAHAKVFYSDDGRPLRMAGVKMDITEHMRTEEALRTSEAALKEAQRLAHVGHWAWSALTGATMWSDEVYRILGIPIGSATPSYDLLFGISDQKDRRRLEEEMSRAVGSSGAVDGNVDFDLPIITPAGAALVVSQRVFVDRDAAGNVVGFHGTCQDITRRVTTEQALRDSEAALAEAQQIAHVGSWIIYPESNEVLASAEWFRIFALDPRPIVTVQEFLDRVHEEDRAGVEAGIAVSLQTGGLDMEFRIVTPQSTRVVHSIARQRGVGESHISLIGTIEDITERKAAEEALRLHGQTLERSYIELEQQILARRESEEAHRRLSTVVEQSAESIIMTNTSGVIEYVNPAFERITGYTHDEVVGQPARILKSGKQDAAFYKNLWSTITAGSVWHGHFVSKRKDGSLYEEDATISPVRDNDGTIANFVAVKHDVTEEVALAEQLRHAQKIDAIGTLAAGVAHDFNNLLQAMLSIVQVLKRKSTESPRNVQNLTQLEKTIRRGSYLTRQLLLFARRETSRRETLDLNKILRDLLEFLRRVVRANIKLSVEPANVPLWISADRGQIEQVIMNLAVNSIDAMPEGGALSIAVGRDEHAVWLKVSDTGTGIPKTIRDRIFEPFFTTKEVGKGTGLGLSVVHGIIVAHGGRIDAECPAEGGTTFRVELPLQDPAAALNTAVPSEEDVPNGRGERVLLVEDDQAAREGLSAILEMLGYSVVAVGAGEEAVGIDEQVPFPVVLTDFMLPGIQGIEVVRRLRERWPGMKAILMSGYAAPGLIDAAVAANEVRFLQKPFDMADLARTLRAVLQPSDAPDRS